MAILSPAPAPEQDGADDGAGDEAGLFAEINITPLTDVILVLLIIFMVSSSAMIDAVREGRLDIDLPRSASQRQQPTVKQSTVIGVLKDGRIVLDGEVLGEEELRERLEALRRRSPEAAVIINADGDLQHRSVVRLLDLVGGLGFPTVSIATEMGSAQ